MVRGSLDCPQYSALEAQELIVNSFSESDQNIVKGSVIEAWQDKKYVKIFDKNIFDSVEQDAVNMMSGG